MAVPSGARGGAPEGPPAAAPAGTPALPPPSSPTSQPDAALHEAGGSEGRRRPWSQSALGATGAPSWRHSSGSGSGPAPEALIRTLCTLMAGGTSTVSCSWCPPSSVWVLGRPRRPPGGHRPSQSWCEAARGGAGEGWGLGPRTPIRGSTHRLSTPPPESPSQATHPSEGFPFISPVSVFSGALKGRRVLLRAERGPAETTPAPSSPLSSLQGSGGVSPCPPPLLAGLPCLSPSLGLSHRHLCCDPWGPGGLSSPRGASVSHAEAELTPRAPTPPTVASCSLSPLHLVASAWLQLLRGRVRS